MNPPRTGRRAATSLRVLSCNILAGASVRRYSHYVTRSWAQVLPGRDKQANLDRLAAQGPGPQRLWGRRRSD